MKKVLGILLTLSLIACSTSKIEMNIKSSTVRFDNKGNCKIYPYNSGFFDRKGIQRYMKGKTFEISDSTLLEHCSIYSDTVIHYLKTGGDKVRIIENVNNLGLTVAKGPSTSCE